MRAALIALSAATLAAGPAAPCFSHHSFAMFEAEKQVTLVGTVKEFQWTNPHSWIQLNVPDASGKLVEWAIEGGSPNQLGRMGWSSGAQKPGDKVTVVARPLKSGEPGATLVTVTTADGKVLGVRQPPKARS